MTTVNHHLARLALLAAFFLTGLTASAQEAKPPVYKAPELKPIAQKLPAVFDKESPGSVADLKAMQDHVAKIVEKVMPAVVCVRVGAAFGSGVIVSKDGYVLTAGHVSGKPDQDVKLFFADGKTAKGKTLGGNHGIDSGMIKITDPGNWPYADMGDCTELKRGHWCMVVAHPGGFKPGRTPPVRLGRVLKVTDSTLTTDCILVGGDSGGPLFDMHGRVIGINSRIGQQLTANLHVPVNPFRDHWEKIAASEVWGGKLGERPTRSRPYIGVEYDQTKAGCVILSIAASSPAEKAGLKVNDVILTFADTKVEADIELAALVQMKKAGDQVELEIRRGEETLTLKLRIGKR